MSKSAQERKNSDTEKHGSMKLCNLLGNVNLKTLQQVVQRNRILDCKVTHERTSGTKNTKTQETSGTHRHTCNTLAHEIKIKL